MAAILSFFRPGIWEIAVILLVVVLIFGAARLPKIGRALGEAIRGFRKSVKDEGEKPPCSE
jgi:sec-independent protein translocase protein TatA